MARNEVTLRDGLVSKLAELMMVTQGKMVSGSAGDFVAYREMVSRLRALHDAIEVVEQLFRQEENDE